MPWLAILLLLPVSTTWALCAPGFQGANGTGALVTIRSSSAGCYTELISGVSAPQIICNGKNGQDGLPPTVTLLPANVTGNFDCAKFTSAVVGGGQATLCNNTQGPQGDTGIQGAAGPQGLSLLPVVTFPASLATAQCQLVASNTTQFPLCNGTIGPTGATGIQGVQGVQGQNASQGPQGTTGTFGSVYPNLLVIDGISGGYGYTCAGIKAALCAVGCGTNDCSSCSTTSIGGTVLVGKPCTAQGVCNTGQQYIQCTSGDTLYIPNGVTLDLGGNVLVQPAASCPTAGMIAMTFYTKTGTPGPAIATTFVTSLPVVGTTPEGGTNITIASQSFVSGGLAAGQYCSVSGMTVDNSVSLGSGQVAAVAGTFFTYLVAFLNSTGILVLQNSLPGSCAPGSCTVQCYTAASILTEVGLQNGALMSSGSNCAGGSIVSIIGAARVSVRNIQLTNSIGGSTTSNPGIVAQAITDSIFTGIFVTGINNANFIGMQLIMANKVVLRDFTCSGNTAILRALDLIDLEQSSVSGFVSQAQVNLVQSANNNFNNLVFTGPAGILKSSGTGLSRRNVFSGLLICGAATFPISLLAGDNFNQFSGLVLRGNNGFGPNIAASSYGNTFSGDLEVLPSVNGNANQTSVGSDFSASNVVRKLANANGFAAISVHNTTVSASDFTNQGDHMMAFNLFTETSFVTSMIGLDGVMRHFTVPLL